MAIDLCGYRVDNGSALSLTALQFRAFRYTAFSTGVANKVEIMGHVTGQKIRFCVYANKPSDSNRPGALLAYTDVVTTTAGVVSQYGLNVPVNVASGQIIHFDFIQESSGANNAIRAGAIDSASRNSGATLSSINDLPTDPRTNGSGTTVTVGPYAMLISDSVGISGIDKLNTAQTSTANFNADFAATSFSISDGTTTKAAAATIVNSASASFVVPAWVDGETAVKVGPVTVTATDGTDTTTAFNNELEFWSSHPDNATVVKFAAVTLTSVDPDNIGTAFDFDPALKIGTQCVFDAARFLISDSGVLTTVGLEDYEGQSIFWFLDPDDHIARDFTLDTSEGAIAPAMPADRTVTVYEGATTLGTFPAASGTPPISYALGGDDAALFTINSETAKVDPVVTLAIGQSGVTSVSATNSAGSDTQTINWSVIALPEPSDLKTSLSLGIGFGIGI